MSQPNNTSQKSESAQTLRFKVTRHEIVEVPNSDAENRLSQIRSELDQVKKERHDLILKLACELGMGGSAQKFLANAFNTSDSEFGYWQALVDIKLTNTSTSNQAA